MSEWISVEDRLPEDGGYVLVTDGDDVYMGFKDKHKGGEYMDVAAESIICCMDITHWQPLPEPPEAIKDKDLIMSETKSIFDFDPRLAAAWDENNCEWPKELTSGVMFYEGLRITADDFKSFSAAMFA